MLLHSICTNFKVITPARLTTAGDTHRMFITMEHRDRSDSTCTPFSEGYNTVTNAVKFKCTQCLSYYFKIVAFAEWWAATEICILLHIMSFDDFQHLQWQTKSWVKHNQWCAELPSKQSLGGMGKMGWLCWKGDIALFEALLIVQTISRLEAAACLCVLRALLIISLGLIINLHVVKLKSSECAN